MTATSTYQLPAGFDDRAIASLVALDRAAALRRTVWAEVLSFYQRHPEVERTELGSAFVACALIEAWGGLDGSSTCAPERRAA